MEGTSSAVQLARRAQRILELGGLLKLLGAVAYVAYAFRSAPGEVRGYSVVAAMFLAVPIFLYGAYDLGAGFAVRRRMALGRALGLLSGAFGLLAFGGLGLMGLSSVVAFAIGRGPTGLVVAACLLAGIAGGVAANASLLSALWKADAAFRG